jgi:hypothetical protein
MTRVTKEPWAREGSCQATVKRMERMSQWRMEPMRPFKKALRLGLLRVTLRKGKEFIFAIPCLNFIDIDKLL